MAYLIAGPMVALIGIVAVFFVLRRKSVEKRSMYSARRSQIEHKVRAARQRTLTPRGRSERRQHEEATMAATTIAPAEAQPTMTWETPAYSAPPVAPPAPMEPAPMEPAAPPPWETTAAPAPAAPSYDYPAAAPAAPAEPAWNPPAPEPFQPAPEPTPMPPSEPAWTPAPAPAAEPVAPLEPVAATSTSASSTAAGWSVVNTDKDAPISEPSSDGKKAKKGGGDTSQWQLASGEAPGIDSGDGTEVKRPNNLMAIAQYAVLVVGLVMVLIGVMVMLANSHVT